MIPTTNTRFSTAIKLFGGFFLAFTVIASVHKYLRGNVNNYYIFTKSFWLLISHQNLYSAHPEYFFDTYKYSPTFPLLIMPFSLLPALAGVILWNCLNAMLLFWAVTSLVREDRKAVLVLSLLTVELFTAVQNNQSNALLAALLIFAFSKLEMQKPVGGALLISLTVFIKIFGLAACALALLYPRKRRFAGFLSLWVCLLLILPLTVLSPKELAQQYVWWYQVIRDFKTGSQLSVMGIIERFTATNPSYLSVQLTGLLLFLSPLIRAKCFSNQNFRLKMLCSLLIFLVIFNQAAESPTYIIAVTGVAIWYVHREKTILDHFLITSVLIFTSLVVTDLFPEGWRDYLLGSYAIKAVPCLLVWLKIQFELMTEKFPTPPGRRSGYHFYLRRMWGNCFPMPRRKSA